LKAVLIALEGIADRPQEALGGKTPLQLADVPHLDALAKRGACGQLYAVAPGICPSADTALWHLLGYGALPYPGRAAFEAIGAGIELNDDDVVFLVSLASTRLEHGERYVQAAPAHLPAEQVRDIVASLSKYKPEFLYARVHHLDGPFMALVLSGDASALVTDSDPLFYTQPIHEIVPLQGGPDAARSTARELNRFTSWARKVLSEHPVNRSRDAEGMTVADHVIIKWPSVKPDVPTLEEKWGLKGVASGPGFFSRGLAIATGMEAMEVMTHETPDGLGPRLDAVREEMYAFRDFALVRSIAADEASHAGRPRRKAKTIEELDAALETVVDSLDTDPDTLIVVTAAYTAPSGGSDEVLHSGESVPVVMCGRNVRVDPVAAFDEVSCARGALGTLLGDDVMPLILSLTDRGRFGTSRIHPGDPTFRPTA
jgi:2,3-bisphosphoglycerate-independent phosphoglycerate mutase